MSSKKPKRPSPKKPPREREIHSPRVAAIQMNSTPDVEANIRQAHELLQEALKRDPNIVAFPENMFLCAEDGNDTRTKAETLDGLMVETLREWSAENDIWILAGSLPIRAKGGKITNTSLLFNPEGEIDDRYDKIHLFDVVVPGDREYRESKSVKAGKKGTLAKTPWGDFGLSICYDIRFPELYRQYSKKGCEAIFIPAAFTFKTGQAHWDILTRARAVENQCYVIAPGQTGSPYPGRQCFGHTRIVDPWGRVIAERPDGIGVVWADLNYLSMAEVRTNLPALAHRKL